MKKIVIFLIIGLASISVFAQEETNPIPVPSTDSNAVYQLFPTQNMWTFIKLNTRNGRMWQVQWHTTEKNRFETSLSLTRRISIEEEKNGRFTLYPTTNAYNFILLDQISGATYQVQWNVDYEKRLVNGIY